MHIGFITGSARSGTTSLLKALALSPCAQVALEPEPTMNRESRLLYDGALPNPHAILARDLLPRLAQGLDKHKIYIEKHVSLVPFVPYLADLVDCKFLIPVRDGRDVVRSMIDWHNHFMPIIYQECTEPAELGPAAQAVLARQQGPDPFDHSLPRPSGSNPWATLWPTLTRFEMCAWYWNYLNQHLLTSVRALPSDRYLFVDYTNPSAADIERCYDFLRLPGFNKGQVQALLERKVNSLTERAGVGAKFPKWRDWTALQTQRFWEFAFPAMHALGYIKEPIRPTPKDFGAYWIGKDIDVAAYETMYQYRARSQAQFRAWSETVLQSAQPIKKVLEIGAGIGIGSTDLFANVEFIGADLAPQVVRWANERVRPGHEFIEFDVLHDTRPLTADLVFSHATADNVYDVDNYLRTMARRSSRLLYLSTYRGYFNGLDDHRIRFDPKMGVCFNDVSPAKAKAVLEAEGWPVVEVLPFRSGREDIPTETMIVASRRPEDQAWIAAGHEVAFDFKPYRVAEGQWTLNGLLGLVNSGCHYFASTGLNLASPLRYFSTMLRDLAALPATRQLGTVGAYSRREGSVNTAIRLDVDIDLPAATALAHLAGKARVPLSFYLLHTAGYYGYWEQGQFRRHTVCAPLYQQLQALGHEVGLHVDALGIYAQHGVDGAVAIVEELRWLRSLGLRVRGITGHNAAPVYGAENAEVFRSFVLGQRCSASDGRVVMPLGALDATALGIDYDGSQMGPANPEVRAQRSAYLAGLPRGDFLRNPAWLRAYLADGVYCRWENDWNVWHLGGDFWAIAGAPKHGGTFQFGACWNDVNQLLHARPADERIVLVLHPIYLGQRSQPQGFPDGYDDALVGP